MKIEKKTETVLGYNLTRVAGKRYVASRPIIGEGIKRGKTELFPVTIVDYDNQNGDPVAHVDDMPYDKANDFLNAFNNGKTSWDGRVW